MLGWRVKRGYRCLKAMHIMSSPPVCIQLVDKVSRIVSILKTYPHNGFPVVDRISEDGTPGHLCGLILRSQLVVIINHRYFDERKRDWQPDISIETFRNEYPRYPSIEVIWLNPNTSTDDSNHCIFFLFISHTGRANSSKRFSVFNKFENVHESFGS